ncbi:MAG: GMP/IMP nucleotidase [Thiohalomonadaceae bacterium]
MNTAHIHWEEIDSVLLDMDGTLLDLNYDTYFWSEHVPQRFAEKNSLTLAAAKEQLYPRFHAMVGTMDWYCLDYWSRELDLEIAQLKEEVEHLIAIHPRAQEFLGCLQVLGKRVVLVTNAHMKSLQLKMARTNLAGYFDAIVCSHEYRLPKEDVSFWTQMQQQQSFAPNRTLLVDDSLAVLRSAQRHGIAHLCAVAKPDSRQPLQEVTEFQAITNFGDIMPVWSGEAV